MFRLGLLKTEKGNRRNLNIIEIFCTSPPQICRNIGIPSACMRKIVIPLLPQKVRYQRPLTYIIKNALLDIMRTYRQAPFVVPKIYSFTGIQQNTTF